MSAPLAQWLDSSGLLKCAAGPSGCLYDSNTRVHFEKITEEQLQEWVSPCLQAGTDVGHHTFVKVISFLCKLLGSLRRVASLQAWRDAGFGSMDKTAMTAESAANARALQVALDRLTDFVDGACAAAGVQDICLAVAHTPPGNTMMFRVIPQDLPWGIMLQRCRTIATAVLDDFAHQWKQSLDALAESIQPHLIEWEALGEKLLTVEQRALTAALLSNPGYAELTPRATAISQMVKVANTHPGMLHAAPITKASEIATSAMKLVSLTFSLYHLKVTWPKIKGQNTRLQPGRRYSTITRPATSSNLGLACRR